MSDSDGGQETPPPIPRKPRAPRQSFIPIVNTKRVIVGWITSDSGPEGLEPRHPEAEALAGGPLRCAYIQITDLADAKRAGAPDDWMREWQCMALCSEGAISSAFQNGVIELARSPKDAAAAAPLLVAGGNLCPGDDAVASAARKIS